MRPSMSVKHMFNCFVIFIHSFVVLKVLYCNLKASFVIRLRVSHCNSLSACLLCVHFLYQDNTLLIYIFVVKELFVPSVIN
jgi:hypothetical protein